MKYEKNIKSAIGEIKAKKFSQAKEYIHLAMIQDDTSPEPHNLLGIIAEITGDLYLSEKHYRAAYALDPTFKTADINLERITLFYYKFDLDSIDYGDASSVVKGNFCSNNYHCKNH